MFPIRICRHCRKPVGLDDKKCKHCKKPLMSPTKYKTVLAVMALILIVAFSFVVYGAVAYLHAKALCAAVNC